MATLVEPAFVAPQRERKALTLAAECRTLGFTPDDVAHFALADRRAVEKSAGTRAGSALTWRLVVSFMVGAAGHRCPWCLIGDPRGVFGSPKDYGHPGTCTR